MTFGKAARVSHTTAYNYKTNPRPKLDPSQTFTANDFYARLPDPRRKTNSKNRSNLNIGDPRAQTFETINMTTFRSRELPNPRAPLVEGFEDMDPAERDKIYRKALERTGIEGVRKLESGIRLKIDQRTSGGPFALRKAFKYFDRDGSGDIDPDEFFAAMDWFGLQFTEDSVLALFGLYDDDRGGSLGYYEFVDNIISSNKHKQGSEECKQKLETFTNPGECMTPGPAVAKSPVSVSKELAKACFDMADKNSSGKIELVELEALFRQFGVKTDSEVLNKAFMILDTDFNGEVSFEEFWNWWHTTVGVFRRRGGAGEQGRARGKNMRAASQALVGRAGSLDMAPSRGATPTPMLEPPQTKSSGRGTSGGFIPSRAASVASISGRSSPFLRRPKSRQGGDVLANMP